MIGDKIQPPPPPPPASNDLSLPPLSPNDSGSAAAAAPATAVDVAAAAPTQNQGGSVVAGNIGGVANVGEAAVYTNNSVNDGEPAVAEEKDPEIRLETLLNCYNRDFKPEVLQRGDFWVLKNYVRADHGPLKCSESITYTTHADYTFLDNLIPLLER